MAISHAAVSTAQANKNGSAKNDAQLLDTLAKLWTVHNTRSLAVRLETGSLLNARLGQPTQRQRRGRSVLKQAAETLHTAESELNRMRWFAYFSKDEQSCWGETPPGSRTWTQFKERLPNLIAALKGNEKHSRSSGDKKPAALVGGFLRLISSATSKLRAENFIVDDTDKEELIGRLKDFASAISKRFGVRFLVETEEDGTRGLETVAVPNCETGVALSSCPMDTVAV